MNILEQKLRDEARKLLADRKVDVFIGYEAGPLAGTTSPVVLTEPDEAERLVVNPFCTLNLAKYAHDLLREHREAQKRVKPEDRKKKVVGLVARGCTTRSIAVHLQERQYGRDELVLVGVPCAGFVDKQKASALVSGAEVLAAEVSGSDLVLTTARDTRKAPLEDLLADNCRSCRVNHPLFADVTLGEPAPARDPSGEYAAVEEIERLAPEERWAYFTKEMGKCIRCYACRNSCPACYCKSCIFEQSQPSWVGTSVDPTDTQVFQLIRLYHQVGRCVDCGACAAACPMGVDLRRYLKKLDKDAFELFGRRAGESLDSRPVLAEVEENDDQAFIFEPS